MKTEYNISAIRRSGHHGVIWWLISHFNDVWYCNNLKLEEIDKNFYNLDLRLIPKDKKNFEKLNVRRLKSSNNLVFNFEDKFCLRSFIQNCYKIYIVRDALNWSASRINKSYSNIKFDKKSIRKYSSFYYEAKKRNFLIISYNKWISSKHYRKKCSRKLGLDWTDAGFLKPSTISSFGNNNFNPSGELPTLKRYKNLSNKDLSFIKKYPSLLKISKEITPKNQEVYKKLKELL